MYRITGRIRARLAAACLATVLLTAAPPAVSSAQVTNDLNDFNLTETTSTWPSNYTVTGWGLAEYRWLDVPAKATVISANACTDLAFFGSQTFPAGGGGTSYRTLAGLATSTCFVIRGRTTAGSGSMSLYDGRVRR